MDFRLGQKVRSKHNGAEGIIVKQYGDINVCQYLDRKNHEFYNVFGVIDVETFILSNKNAIKI